MPATLEQFQGCLLGLAVGDALCAPFEGMPADAIYYGFGLPSQIVARPPQEQLCYTDDTEMAIAVAEALVERKQVETATLVASFARHFHPDRGYGQGARKVLEAMRAGGDWESIARNLFPGGSCGNGAAMRVAPVGVFFCDDLDLAEQQAALSALPTHRHPLGIEGAQLLAIAAALAVHSTPWDPGHFWQTLISRACSEEYRQRLELAASLKPTDSVAQLGNSILALDSVVTAIACFALDVDDYSRVLSRALGLGDDVDTIAAMAGALSGARLGLGAIPTHLLDRLEDGPRGKRHLISLGQRLFAARPHSPTSR